MRTRKGFTLSELAIAMSLTAFIALLAIGLLNMSTKASVLTRQANTAITYEVSFTEAIEDVVQTATSIYTIPKTHFKQSDLTKGWNYIALLNLSEYSSVITDDLLANTGIGTSGGTPIKESFDDGKGNTIEAGNALVQIKYSGTEKPADPADGVVLSAVGKEDGITYYYVVHIMGYDYTGADGLKHVYTLDYTCTGDVGAQSIDFQITDNTYRSTKTKINNQDAYYWKKIGSDPIGSHLNASNTLTVRDEAAGKAVAFGYQGKDDIIIPDTEKPVDPTNTEGTEATKGSESSTEQSQSTTETESSSESQSQTESSSESQSQTETSVQPTSGTGAPDSKYKADFTVAILMDVSSFRDDNQVTAWQNRMSDGMTNGVSRFNNMKNIANQVITELSKYRRGNLILIPFSYAAVIQGNFTTQEIPDTLAFNTAGDVTEAKALINNLKLAGGSNPGDAVRLLYNELTKIEYTGGSVGKLAVIMITGREMGSWSTNTAGRATIDGVSATNPGSDYFLADKTRAGYDPFEEYYPPYVRTNYYYWENGRFDAAFWFAQSTTWVAAGNVVHHTKNIGSIDEYVPDNIISIKDSKAQISRYRGATDTHKIHDFRQSQLQTCREYMIAQVELLKRDFDFSTYSTEVTGRPVEKENLYVIALWNINNKTREKYAFERAGFTLINDGNNVPTSQINTALSRITTSIKKVTAPNGL